MTDSADIPNAELLRRVLLAVHDIVGSRPFFVAIGFGENGVLTGGNTSAEDQRALCAGVVASFDQQRATCVVSELVERKP